MNDSYFHVAKNNKAHVAGGISIVTLFFCAVILLAVGIGIGMWISKPAPNLHSQTGESSARIAEVPPTSAKQSPKPQTSAHALKAEKSPRGTTHPQKITPAAEAEPQTVAPPQPQAPILPQAVKKEQIADALSQPQEGETDWDKFFVSPTNETVEIELSPNEPIGDALKELLESHLTGMDSEKKEKMVDSTMKTIQEAIGKALQQAADQGMDISKGVQSTISIEMMDDKGRSVKLNQENPETPMPLVEGEEATEGGQN